MAITRYYNPLRNLLQRFWDEDWDIIDKGERIVPADIYEKDNAYYMDLELPGMKKEDINIELSGNILKVSGEYKKDKEVKGKNYYRCEIREGSFSRSFTIPEEVKEEDIKAKFKNGILTLQFPKTEKEEVKKRIKVE